MDVMEWNKAIKEAKKSKSIVEILDALEGGFPDDKKTLNSLSHLLLLMANDSYTSESVLSRILKTLNKVNTPDSDYIKYAVENNKNWTGKAINDSYKFVRKITLQDEEFLPDLSDFKTQLINDDRILEKLKKYKSSASWAVWDKNDNSFPYSMIPYLKRGCVLVAFNPARSDDTGESCSWCSFHENEKNDINFRNAIVGTDLEGCYITDIIKTHVGTDSSLIKAALTEEIIDCNVKCFLKEIEFLGDTKVLVAIGNDAFSILSHNSLIIPQYRIIKIPHYSAAYLYNKQPGGYEGEVKRILSKYNL